MGSRSVLHPWEMLVRRDAVELTKVRIDVLVISSGHCEAPTPAHRAHHPRAAISRARQFCRTALPPRRGSANDCPRLNALTASPPRPELWPIRVMPRMCVSDRQHLLLQLSQVAGGKFIHGVSLSGRLLRRHTRRVPRARENGPATPRQPRSSRPPRRFRPPLPLGSERALIAATVPRQPRSSIPHLEEIAADVKRRNAGEDRTRTAGLSPQDLTSALSHMKTRPGISLLSDSSSPSQPRRTVAHQLGPLCVSKPERPRMKPGTRDYSKSRSVHASKSPLTNGIRASRSQSEHPFRECASTSYTPDYLIPLGADAIKMLNTSRRDSPVRHRVTSAMCFELGSHGAAALERLQERGMNEPVPPAIFT